MDGNCHSELQLSYMTLTVTKDSGCVGEEDEGDSEGKRESGIGNRDERIICSEMIEF